MVIGWIVLALVALAIAFIAKGKARLTLLAAVIALAVILPFLGVH